VKHPKAEAFKQLTWDDIKAWAGINVTSRGQSYQRSHRVQELACTSNGGLVAWVKGAKTYATLVNIEEEELTSACTCPYGDVCKHAVAVVLEYLEKLNQNIQVPTVAEGDPRLTLLENAQEGVWYGKNEDLEQCDVQLTAWQSQTAAPDALHSYLEKQSKAELVTLIKDMTERYPGVHEAIHDRCHLSQGDVSALVNNVRKEIERLSAEPAWVNPWKGERNVPDYSEVRDRLVMLLTKGYADEVIGLGKRLLEAGTQQVEMSDDEGETAGEISACMNVVFEALSRSSIPPGEQMLWAMEADLNDEYELCGGAEVFWEQQHAVADWDTLADKLLQRLNTFESAKGEDRFSRDYRRDRLVDWVIMAHENGGRRDEIIPLCEQEAIETGSYVRLAKQLLAAGRREEAEQWIHKGIKAIRNKWPGITSELRAILRGMLEQGEDWLSVAAFRGDDFFTHPTLETFKALREAAERAEVWPAVRAAAIYYLETGQLPERTERAVGGRTILPWPLPETGVRETTEMRQKDFPMAGTLIDIAIAEKRTDEVIRWHDKSGARPMGLGQTWFQEDQVAKAIAEAYPDRAIAIWKKLTESQIAQAQPKAYEVAAGFLRNMRRTFRKLGRDKEWQSYIAGQRQANARKRRLLEILDSLDDRPIIEMR
jgi:uncharacterized Zn finger protein